VTVTDVTRQAYEDGLNGPFVNSFELEVDPPDNMQPHPGGRNGTPPAAAGKNTAPRLSLPLIKEVRRGEWSDEFDEYAALRIKHNGDEGFDFTVNMDNTFLLTEMARGRESDKALAAFWFKYGLALCALGVLQDQRHRRNGAAHDGHAGDHDPEHARDDLAEIGRYTDGVARVFIPVIRSLYRGPLPAD
jgi:hypothetical protein